MKQQKKAKKAAKMFSAHFLSGDKFSDAYYKAPCCVNVPEGTRLPVIDEFTTFKFFSQQKRTAAGKKRTAVPVTLVLEWEV